MLLTQMSICELYSNLKIMLNMYMVLIVLTNVTILLLRTFLALLSGNI